MTKYIDARNPDITPEEALELATRQAKPYPTSWYETAEEFLEYKAQNDLRDLEELHSQVKSDVRFWNPRTKGDTVTARYRNVSSRWAEHSCSVEQWKNLSHPI